MVSASKWVTFSNRVYGLLLFLYPVPFRRTFGADMAQVFRDDMRATLRSGGLPAVIGLWLWALIDLLQTATAEHVWEVFHMPIEKLTRWSGPAGAVGGGLHGIGVVVLFWGWDSGADTTGAFALIFLAATCLIGLGVYGLYKNIPATAGPFHVLVFGAALGGLILSNLGTAVLMVWTSLFETPVLTAVSIGANLYIVGLAGLSILAIATRALGRWRFTPLLVAAAYLSGLARGWGIEGLSPLIIVPLTSYALSWLLLGVGLWKAQFEPFEPGVFT